MKTAGFIVYYIHNKPFHFHPLCLSLCFISITRLTPSLSLKINRPYAASWLHHAVTSCPSHTLSPLTPHLSLFHHLFLNSFITSLLLSFISFTRAINPFLSCNLPLLFSYALTNCTYLSRSCSLNALILVISLSLSGFLSHPPSCHPIPISQTPLLN